MSPGVVLQSPAPSRVSLPRGLSLSRPNRPTWCPESPRVGCVWRPEASDHAEASRCRALVLRLSRSSKVSRDTLYEAVREVLHGNQRKRRK